MMTNRPNLPKTSLDANKRATPEMRDDHKQKILEALGKLKNANYEKIASVAKLDKHAVHRRINELERMGAIYKTNMQSATSTGRLANNYALIGQPVLSAEELVSTIITNVDVKKKKPVIETETPLYNLFK